MASCGLSEHHFEGAATCECGGLELSGRVPRGRLTVRFNAARMYGLSLDAIEQASRTVQELRRAGLDLDDPGVRVALRAVRLVLAHEQILHEARDHAS